MRCFLAALACWMLIALSSSGGPLSESASQTQAEKKTEQDKGKAVVIGYSYQSDSKMKTVRVAKPLPGGQATFELVVGDKTFPLEAGKPFYFTNQFPDGVDFFIIRGINPSEKLDPKDVRAFPTGISWMDVKPHEITMTPITKPSSAKGK